MTYSEFLNILSAQAETEFADFQRRLIFTNYQILGVRTPTMRKIAKQYMENIEEIFVEAMKQIQSTKRIRQNDKLEGKKKKVKNVENKPNKKKKQNCVIV